ncbi:hypothetical protein K8I31_04205 [bacterium]|nr:hypothetical protein [bacterium]
MTPTPFFSPANLIGRLKALIRSRITWSVVFVVYLFGVWLSAYKIEATSWSEWPETKKLGCVDISKYAIKDRKKKPNPWLLKTVTDSYFSKTILDNAPCLGAYLKDISIYKYYSANLIIYDEEQDVVLFRIQKPRTQYF